MVGAGVVAFEVFFLVVVDFHEFAGEGVEAHVHGEEETEAEFVRFGKGGEGGGGCDHVGKLTWPR